MVNNFPSRVSKLNIYFVASYYLGKVTQANIQITNGGSSYTSAPTIVFNNVGGTTSTNNAVATAVIQNGILKGINITNGGDYYGFTPPQITISGGGGNGATAIVTKLEGGATGHANGASQSLPINNYVVLCHCHEAEDWIYGMTLAHELGHDLDLDHTYCGGGAPAKICLNYCSNRCSDLSSNGCSDEEFLSDIFGSCPGTYPHHVGWYNPTSSDPQHTNNVMGGSNSQVYFSPMQVGQMHRTLALKSTRKYVKKETYSPIPLVITSNETWDFNLKLYRDVNIVSGAVLTISNTFELPYNGTVTVNNGAALIITGTIKLEDLNKIIVKSGGTVKFASTSNIQISGSGKVEVLSGGYFCIENGAAITLSNFNSVINLRNGYINGVNTSVVPSSNCVSSPASYVITGNGKINLFNQDVYIQNETISTNRYIAGRNIYVGRAVTNTKPQGDVMINNNANVIFDANDNVTFDTGFDCALGATFEVTE